MQEEVAALVTMTEGNIDEQGLIEYLKERLALFKVPKYVFQIKTFPMTGSGKNRFKANPCNCRKICRREKGKKK
ncbi:MAG: AMP-binding enzyme [Coprococcus sp.]